MARIYANENFYRPVVAKLREFGHDVLTTLEAGKANQKIPDEEVLLFAIAEERVMLTLNRRHFMRLHRLYPKHFGIIVCTEDGDFEALAIRINQVLEGTGDNLENQLMKIYRSNPNPTT